MSLRGLLRMQGDSLQARSECLLSALSGEGRSRGSAEVFSEVVDGQ